MEPLNFERWRKRAEKIRSLAGPFLERLDNGRFITDWLQEVEAEDPAVAQALREHIQAVESADQGLEWERLDKANRAQERLGLSTFSELTASTEAPLWPDVDRKIPDHSKRFNNFESRSDFPYVAMALKSVECWVVGVGEAPMLTLAGVPGTGKTHLARAAAIALAESNHEVIYREEAQFIAEAMERMESKTTERLISAVCEVGWLIWDDMGVAAMGDWARGTMDRIINDRYELAQAGTGYTLITSNVMRKDQSPRLARRLNEPGVSRVCEIRAARFYA